MTVPTLEERVAALEAEIRQMKQSQAPESLQDDTPWWKRIVGVFKDAPEFEEAMRLGREYRESLRPPDYEES